jgi:phosphoenolpyruvate carboxylase
MSASSPNCSRPAASADDYASLDENARVALLRHELASPRLLTSPYADYSEETASELAIVRAAADAHAKYGPQCITHYIVSMAQSVSDLLEVHVLLKEAGLYTPGDAPQRADHGDPPVRDDRRSRGAPAIMEPGSACPKSPRSPRRAAIRK